MASFDKLTRANMMKYIQDEELMETPKAQAKEKDEAAEHRKIIEKRNKQAEEDRKVLPPRRGTK